MSKWIKGKATSAFSDSTYDIYIDIERVFTIEPMYSPGNPPTLDRWNLSTGQGFHIFVDLNTGKAILKALGIED